MSFFDRGYVPAYGDWDFDMGDMQPGVRIKRTKSRAFQCCCWQGYVGLHDFFLGRYLRGALRAALAALVVEQLVSSIFHFNWKSIVLALAAASICIVWWMVDIDSLSKMDPEDKIFSGSTPAGYAFIFHKAGLLSPIWGKNFWGEPAIEEFNSIEA